MWFVVVCRCLYVLGLWFLVDWSNKMEELFCVFDLVLLEFLVCLFFKKLFRYEVLINELINEELGIVYLVIDGIFNMIL